MASTFVRGGCLVVLSAGCGADALLHYPSAATMTIAQAHPVRRPDDAHQILTLLAAQWPGEHLLRSTTSTKQACNLVHLLDQELTRDNN